MVSAAVTAAAAGRRVQGRHHNGWLKRCSGQIDVGNVEVLVAHVADAPPFALCYERLHITRWSAGLAKKGVLHIEHYISCQIGCQANSIWNGNGVQKDCLLMHVSLQTTE